MELLKSGSKLFQFLYPKVKNFPWFLLRTTETLVQVYIAETFKTHKSLCLKKIMIWFFCIVLNFRVVEKSGIHLPDVSDTLPRFSVTQRGLVSPYSGTYIEAQSPHLQLRLTGK